MSRARIRLATSVLAAVLAVAGLPASAFAASAPQAASSARSPLRYQAGAEPIVQIPLQGAVNVRDLGGYRTYTGVRSARGWSTAPTR